MTAAHSILPPSGADAWVVCAMWALVHQMYPESDTHKKDSDEGNASHWAGFEIVHNSPVAVGQVAPNGIVLNDEMIDGAQLYVDAIDARLLRWGVLRDVLHVEERVDCFDIHALNWGTPDSWFYLPQHNVLEIFDYKFGHRYIDAFENWQLINYCAGILQKIGITGVTDQSLHVNLHVVQPRSYHRDGPVRTWHMLASDLRGYFNTLRNAADRAMQQNPEATANAACLDCRGRHECEAAQRDGYRTADISTRSLPVAMPAHALGLELKYLTEAFKRLEGRITGLQEQVRQRIMAGELIPFWAMNSSAGSEKWKVPPGEVAALGQVFGKDLLTHKPVTPTQARDIFKKAGFPADVIAQYSERSTSLALEFDDGRQARKVFGK